MHAVGNLHRGQHFVERITLRQFNDRCGGPTTAIDFDPGSAIPLSHTRIIGFLPGIIVKSKTRFGDQIKIWPLQAIQEGFHGFIPSRIGVQQTNVIHPQLTLFREVPIEPESNSNLTLFIRQQVNAIAHRVNFDVGRHRGIPSSIDFDLVSITGIPYPDRVIGPVASPRTKGNVVEQPPSVRRILVPFFLK